MINWAVNTVWDNNYSRLSIVFIICYIFFNAAGNPFNRFDYIIILYILCLKQIDENTALQYALLFGIFYDLNYHIFIGLGVLLFQMLNIIKIYAYLMIDMSKLYSRQLFIVGILALYLLLTLKFFGYPPLTYWNRFLYYICINLSGILVIMLFRGIKYVISNS